MYKVVGWSASTLEKTCNSCEKVHRHEVIQLQKKLIPKPLSLIGIGKRQLGYVCLNCNKIIEFSEKDQSKYPKLRFYTKSKKHTTTLRVDKTKSKKYPVLTEERWNHIRKSNYKEGLLSGGIGSAVGLFVAIFNVTIGLIIIVLSILGGLYGAFEDPEAKHRAIIDKYGYQK